MVNATMPRLKWSREVDFLCQVRFVQGGCVLGADDAFKERSDVQAIVTPTYTECRSCSSRLLCACELDVCVCARNSMCKTYFICEACAFAPTDWLSAAFEGFSTDDEGARCSETLARASMCSYCDRDSCECQGEPRFR